MKNKFFSRVSIFIRKRDMNMSKVFGVVFGTHSKRFQTFFDDFWWSDSDFQQNLWKLSFFQKIGENTIFLQNSKNHQKLFQTINMTLEIERTHSKWPFKTLVSICFEKNFNFKILIFEFLDFLRKSLKMTNSCRFCPNCWLKGQHLLTKI